MSEANCEVLFTAGTFTKCTSEQLEAIATMAASITRKHIHVMFGGFDLPTGYISFRYDYEPSYGSGSIYGGIAPNGDVST